MKEREKILRYLLGEETGAVGVYRPEGISVAEAQIKSYERLIRLIPRIAKKTRFLIVNSGAGASAHFIYDRFECRVHGLCADENLNGLNQEKIDKKAVSKKMAVSKMANANIPYEGESFDLIWSQDFFHMYGRKKKLFREIHRVLVPEGRLIFTSLYLNDSVRDEMEIASIKERISNKEMISITSFHRLAKRSFLQPIFYKDNPENAILHFRKMLDLLSESKELLITEFKAKAVLKLESEWKENLRLLETGKFGWGIFLFQKINS